MVAVGRDSLRSGSDVWIVNDGTLHIRNLDIARADENYAYVISGLEDGSEIVVSTLGNVVDGMKVRVLK